MVRGGDDKTRKTVLALALALTTTAMLVQPVSAQDCYYYVKVHDDPGDLIQIRDWNFDPTKLWEENSSIGRLGYLDMLFFWLEQDGDEFTFGMELADDLLQMGEKLPKGFRFLRYNMWIDAAPWPSTDPVESYFAIWLVYDESGYSAEIWSYDTLQKVCECGWEITGSTLEIFFSGASIGGLSTFWFSAGVKLINHPDPGPLAESYCYLIPDFVDRDAIEYQEQLSIPWPYPPEE